MDFKEEDEIICKCGTKISFWHDLNWEKLKIYCKNCGFYRIYDKIEEGCE